MSEEKTIDDVLRGLGEFAGDDMALKGRLFERLVVNFLSTDRMYQGLFDKVWHWDKWPHRWGKDLGIDVVARLRGGDERYWAIQCKFYGEHSTVTKEDIDSFMSESGKEFSTPAGKRQFARRLIVSTTNRWSDNAKSAIKNQAVRTSVFSLKDFRDSTIDWDQFSIESLKKEWELKNGPRKTLHDFQQQAVNDVIDGFKEHDRGQLIMACGTGKTLTAIRLSERFVPKGGRILFLSPSLSLISQTLREWASEAMDPLYAFVVCSDEKIGRGEEDMFIDELVYPATTDAVLLAKKAKKVGDDRHTVVFSTYQSIGVVSEAQARGLGRFDLIICDEAHRTSGVASKKFGESAFLEVHSNGNVAGDKRLYMTATPRIYDVSSKVRAERKEATLYSMDDEDTFGPEFHHLSFSEAVENQQLSDYKVLIVAQPESAMNSLAEEGGKSRHVRLDDSSGIDLEYATKIIGSWKGMAKQGVKVVNEMGDEEDLTEDTAPMRRVVSFSRTIKASRQVSEAFKEVTKSYVETAEENGDEEMIPCELDHVNGTMDALERARKLDWLREEHGENECRVLTNARCLSEGVDVPALDGVIFFDTRESIVDIVQSVGRVMRKAKDKKYGYIVLPVCIPSESIPDYDRYMATNERFSGIWKVLKALRAHDERLVSEATFREKVKVLRTVVEEEDEKDDEEAGVQGAGESEGEEKKEWEEQELPGLLVRGLAKSLYTIAPKKLGDLLYWSEVAKDVAKLIPDIKARVEILLENPEAEKKFDAFLEGLLKNLNPAVTREDAVEMLVQHIVTRPIFEALFEDNSFVKDNPVSREVEGMSEMLSEQALGHDVKKLNPFYGSVRNRVRHARDAKARQELIHNLYDTFFKHGFPKVAQGMGIVYTPPEIVDFILRSADFALRKHFDANMSSPEVQVLDPFTGTGTFMAQLLESDLIKPDDLGWKYRNNLHANEIVLLAYYIASINIESVFERKSGAHEPFPGIVFADTFQMGEGSQDEEEDLAGKKDKAFHENSEQARRQNERDIRVIIGNPPYKAGQRSANDNNPNLDYPGLDGRIRETYASESSAISKKTLYDSYVRAIRWSTDRIKDEGVIAFVTNGSFIDRNTANGLRKCLVEEFSHLYVFNLRGNTRAGGQEWRKEGGQIFGGGSRATIAITVMVKDPSHQGGCELRYHDIGDGLSREKKLAVIEAFGSIEKINWQLITPNEDGDWINQRDQAFDKFALLGSKKKGASEVVFNVYSLGVATNRDPWVYNYSRQSVTDNVRRMIAKYNEEMKRYRRACEGKAAGQLPQVEEVTDQNPENISWTRALKKNAEKGKTFEFDAEKIITGMHRPFVKQWLYFDASRGFNEEVYRLPNLFPTPGHKNIVISTTGRGASSAFSALATSFLPDIQMAFNGQNFPLYWYEKINQNKKGQLVNEAGDGEVPDAHSYVRRDGVSDWALAEFRSHYGDDSISKEDLFWYIYGVFHSGEYKRRFEYNLRKEIPRIPFAGDFRAFSKAGKALCELHLNYETAKPYPLKEHAGELPEVVAGKGYEVDNMQFGKKDKKGERGKEKDKSVIIYNGNVALSKIPLKAYEYVVNGRSAIEWIMERYRVSTDAASGIRNDPNDWAPDNPRYILDLLKRIVTVSVESVKIINSLPPLDEHKD